jgi:hypothetical protein
MRRRRTLSLRRFASASMMNLTVRPQDAAEAGFASHIDAFICEHRHNARRWQVCKPWLIRDPKNAFALLRTQGMRRWCSYGVRASIRAR